MADITATIASQLAQAAQTIQRSPPPKPEPKTEESSSQDTPSVKVDSGLLATLSVDESEAPADAKAAKETARSASEELAGQSLSIANLAPQKLQGLFH